MLDQLIADLAREEGFREFAYDDATGEAVTRGSALRGYVTIGYGFCVDRHAGKPLPRSIADAWLRHIVADVWADLTVRLPWVMEQPDDVQRGLCLMAYQMGVSGLLRFEHLLGALRAGDREMAAQHALNSRWGREQTPARAVRVAELIRGAA